MRYILSLLSIITLPTIFTGCVTNSDINSSFRKIDEVWAIDYQKTEDEYRYRVMDCDIQTAMRAMRATLLELRMPITERSYTRDVLVAEAAAPTPLTREQWEQVVKVEAPRVKEIGGWYMKLQKNPSGYMVKVIASFQEHEGKTIVLLDYELDNPKYRSMGFIPSRYAPADAVRMGSIKLWEEMEKQLKDMPEAKPRMRKEKEEKIKFHLTNRAANIRNLI